MGAAAIGPRCLAPDEVRGAVMGAAAIELRNCVVRKDYTVSYAAMTVYDGMTLSSFPVVEPMVVGVWLVFGN